MYEVMVTQQNTTKRESAKDKHPSTREIWREMRRIVPAPVRLRASSCSLMAEGQRPWWSFLCRMIICLGAITLIHVALRSCPQVLSNDLDTHRYFFSATAQSLAAIMAIGLSALFICVQIAAAHYPPQVLNRLIGDWKTHYVMSWYVVTIGFCLLLLGIVPGTRPPIWDGTETPSMESCTWLFHHNSVLSVYILAAVALLAMVLYSMDRVASMQREAVFSRLANDAERSVYTSILRVVYEYVRHSRLPQDDIYRDVLRMLRDIPRPELHALVTLVKDAINRGDLELTARGFTKLAQLIRPYCQVTTRAPDLQAAELVPVAEILSAIDDLGAIGVDVGAREGTLADRHKVGTGPIGICRMTLWEVWQIGFDNDEGSVRRAALRSLSQLTWPLFEADNSEAYTDLAKAAHWQASFALWPTDLHDGGGLLKRPGEADVQIADEFIDHVAFPAAKGDLRATGPRGALADLQIVLDGLIDESETVKQHDITHVNRTRHYAEDQGEREAAQRQEQSLRDQFAYQTETAKLWAQRVYGIGMLTHFRDNPNLDIVGAISVGQEADFIRESTRTLVGMLQQGAIAQRDEFFEEIHKAVSPVSPARTDFSHKLDFLFVRPVDPYERRPGGLAGVSGYRALVYHCLVRLHLEVAHKTQFGIDTIACSELAAEIAKSNDLDSVCDHIAKQTELLEALLGENVNVAQMLERLRAKYRDLAAEHELREIEAIRSAPVSPNKIARLQEGARNSFAQNAVLRSLLAPKGRSDEQECLQLETLLRNVSGPKKSLVEEHDIDFSVLDSFGGEVAGIENATILKRLLEYCTTTLNRPPVAVHSASELVLIAKEWAKPADAHQTMFVIGPREARLHRLRLHGQIERGSDAAEDLWPGYEGEIDNIVFLTNLACPEDRAYFFLSDEIGWFEEIEPLQVTVIGEEPGDEEHEPKVLLRFEEKVAFGFRPEGLPLVIELPPEEE